MGFYVIRSKDGSARCGVSRDMFRNLVRKYLGEWKDSPKGESCYVFREQGAYGNNEVKILIFPGDYVNVEEQH